MRYAKTIRIAALAAIAAMALSATASATQLTSPEGTVYTGSAEAESGEITIHGGPGQYICQRSPAKGSVKSHGSSSTVVGELTSWAFENCTGHVTVKSKGTITIHKEGTNGIVTSSGAEVEATNTNLGISCVFSTNETQIGTFTGSNKSNAVVDLEGMVPRTGGSVFCGSAGELTGSYVITSPSTLSLD